MLLIHKSKIWVDAPALGASFLLTPLSSDDRDACLAEAASAATPEAASRDAVEQARDRVFYAAVGRLALHGWKGVAHVNANGDVEEVPYSAEFAAYLMTEREVAAVVTEKALGLGLKVFKSLEEAGNALSGASIGIEAAAGNG